MQLTHDSPLTAHWPGAHTSIFLGSSWFDRSSPWARRPFSPYALAPRENGAVGGDGDAVVQSSRCSDDVLASKGLDLLRQQLALLVAVAQLATGSLAPAPGGSVGVEGEAVPLSRQHSDDA